MKSLLVSKVLILGLVVVGTSAFTDWLPGFPSFPELPSDWPSVDVGVHVRPGGKCHSDSECPADNVCRDHTCIRLVRRIHRSPDPRIEDRPRPCDDDYNCLSNAHCIDGHCKNRSPQDLDGDDVLQVVKPDACFDDSHCFEDAECYEGHCTARKIRQLEVQTCENGETCEEGECTNGLCLR